MAELERLSHSSAHTYNECGERWRLERVEKVDKVPWLAGPAGSAFHKASEHYDLGLEVGQFQGFLIDELMEDGVGFDQDYNPMPGELERYRVSRGETYEWWCRAGDHMIEQFIAWRERSKWEVWESDFNPEWNEDGTAVTNGWMHGVELPFEVMLPGMSVPDKGYIDRIYVMPDGRVILVDLKTWARERATTQLPHYFAVARHLGIPVDGVAYYDARLGRPTGIAYPTDDPEKPWDIDRLSGLLLPVERGIIGDVFEPKPGSQCGWCSVAHACAYKMEKK